MKQLSNENESDAHMNNEDNLAKPNSTEDTNENWKEALTISNHENGERLKIKRVA